MLLGAAVSRQHPEAPDPPARRFDRKMAVVGAEEPSVTFLNGPTVTILKMHIPRADSSMGIRTIAAAARARGANEIDLPKFI